MTLSDNIAFKKFSIKIENDGFYLINVNETEDFTVEDFKLLVGAQKEMGERYLPSLVLCSENASTDFELLKVIAKNEHNPYSKADAFIIHSLPQRILANFYIKMNNPERPTKFFNNKKDALDWLNQFI